MKPSELLRHLETIKRVKGDRFDELTVAIPLSDPSVGGTAFTKVKFIGEGFDWDTGKLFLFPEREVISKSKEDLQ